MKFRVAACALLAVVAGASSSAFADGNTPANPSAAPEITVRLDDLDLTHAGGVQLLLTRMKRAAREACAAGAAPSAAAKRKYDPACVERAMDSAVARVDTPLVTARHHGRVSARPGAN